MIKTVIWTETAKNDLQNIKNFYDQRNQSNLYSKKLLKTFRDAAKLIEKFPTLSIQTDQQNIRGFAILRYIIFYEILKDTIVVLFVWDCRRDPEQLNKILNK
jgi:toxin YoeB